MATGTSGGTRLHNLLLNRNSVGQHSSESAGVLSPYSINHLDIGKNWQNLGVLITPSAHKAAYLGNGIIIISGGGVDRAIFRSSDYGVSYTKIINVASASSVILAIAYLGNGIVVTGDNNATGHIQRSTDFGITWTDEGAISASIINTLSYLGEGIVIFGDSNGFVQRSTDFGISWLLAIGVSANTINSSSYLENGIVVVGDSTGKIFRSTNITGGFPSFTQVANTGSIIDDFSYLSNGVIIAGCNNGHIWRSTDFGANWTDLGNITGPVTDLLFIYFGNGVVTVGTGLGGVGFPTIFRSIDYGITWTNLSITGIGSAIVTSTYLSIGIGIYVTAAGQVFRSDVSSKVDEARATIHNDLLDRNLTGISAHNAELVGTLSPYSINHLDIGGNSGLTNGGYISEGVITGGTAVNILLNMGNGVAIFGTTLPGHIFKSTDYGGQGFNNTWTDLQQQTAFGINAMAYLGNGFVAMGDSNGVIFSSIDFGVNWSNRGQPAGAVNINSMAYLSNAILIAGTSNGKIIRAFSFATAGAIVYVVTTPGSGASINSISYLENGIAIFVDAGGNILRSTDFGTTWTSVTGNPISLSAFFSSEYLGNGIALAGDAGGHIFRSTDFGVTWTNVNPLGFGAQIDSIKYHGNGIVIFTQTNGHVFRSSDYGLTWTDFGDITGAAIPILTSAYLGNGVTLLGDNTGHIYKFDLSYKTDEAESIIDPSHVFTSSNLSLGQSHNFVEVSAGVNITITIPAASLFQIGHEIIIKKTDPSANTVTISPLTTIDGAATKVLDMQYQSITIRTDGQFWFIV